ncbi:DNA processing/uptake protein [Spiroplasma helicoides]|uniref:DNA processing/uptake protein n=1 Tax=Spiroplasma helicoides TaxID=216938 RepID=A0A1B3SJY7_9MOLU|nr:DNA-processing protein DprA [Spiroplasma helicoides]AOG60240.1 DNA processing/uptake protein [Spiroplasma helicoides]
MEKVLLYFSLKYNGDWDKIYNALDNKEKISQEDLENVAKNLDCEYISIISPLYPNYLKSSHKPPFVIFYKGDIEILSKYNRTITMVGGNKFDDYGLKKTIKMVEDLAAENRVIVTYQNSGLNEEIISKCKNESYEHILVLTETMREYAEKTINSKISKNALVLSEVYNKDKNIEQKYSLYKNRLLCGLSKGILFTQYGASDAFSTLVNYAINEGKEIFAIPCITKSLNETNKLIKMGAKLAENVKDIVNEI